MTSCGARRSYSVATRCIGVLQDNLFPGNRIGCNPATGVSIPSFKKIAAAYILPL